MSHPNLLLKLGDGCRSVSGQGGGEKIRRRTGGPKEEEEKVYGRHTEREKNFERDESGRVSQEVYGACQTPLHSSLMTWMKIVICTTAEGKAKSTCTCTACWLCNTSSHWRLSAHVVDLPPLYYQQRYRDVGNSNLHGGAPGSGGADFSRAIVRPRPRTVQWAENASRLHHGR